MNEITPGPGGRHNTTLHIIVLVAVTAACLLPFAGKAFHIDDPLFIWAARHIQSSPFDFYGFDVNWYGTVQPMSDVMKNPPLVSYYIAVAASVVGWSEKALHLAFLLPVLAMALGTYFIARRFTTMPLHATLAGVLTPVVLVSATTVMSDVMMMAFWCWAVVLWLRGLERDEPASLFAAGVLLALSALTKYFGMSLIPLLAVYSFFGGYRIRRWAPYMLVPVLILAGYQWATFAMYGRGLLLDAAGYAVNIKAETGMSYIQKGFVGLVFTGGCVITPLFYMPAAWSRRMVLFLMAVAAGVGVILLIVKGLDGAVLINNDGYRYTIKTWAIFVQLLLFCVAGIIVLAYTAGDLFRQRDASSLFLFMWLVGTFVFASFLNWTTSGRSVLPMAPVAGILLMRYVERSPETSWSRSPLRLLMPLVPALFIAVMVTWADYSFANSARTAATDIYEKYGHGDDRLWFQGHWGFQYYMQEAGVGAIDFDRLLLKKGDIVVLPVNNTGLVRVTERMGELIDDIRYRPSSRLATVSSGMGAGFYSNVWGPLPYAVGPKFQDVYLIYRIKSG